MGEGEKYVATSSLMLERVQWKFKSVDFYKDFFPENKLEKNRGLVFFFLVGQIY